MTDVFILINVNVSFNNLEPTPPSISDFRNVGQVRDLMVQHRPQVPDVEALYPVQLDNWGGSSVGLVVAVVVVMAVLIRRLCRPTGWVDRPRVV